MKKKEFDQLKQKSLEELKQMVEKTRTEALKIKIEIGRGKTKNVHGYKALRKEIAKVLTLISEKAPLSLSSREAILGAEENK